MEGDLTYFRRRASDERTAALWADHPKARLAHLGMADRYDDLVRVAEGERWFGRQITPVYQNRTRVNAPVQTQQRRAITPQAQPVPDRNRKFPGGHPESEQSDFDSAA